SPSSSKRSPPGNVTSRLCFAIQNPLPPSYVDPSGAGAKRWIVRRRTNVTCSPRQGRPQLPHARQRHRDRGLELGCEHLHAQLLEQPAERRDLVGGAPLRVQLVAPRGKALPQWHHRLGLLLIL